MSKKKQTMSEGKTKIIEELFMAGISRTLQSRSWSWPIT